MDTESFAALLEETAGIDARSLRVLHQEPNEAPIWRLTVPMVGAFGIWSALRDAAEEAGHWPVLLGDNQEVEAHCLNLRINPTFRPVTTAHLLTWAEHIDIEAWVSAELERQSREREDVYGKAGSIDRDQQGTSEAREDEPVSYLRVTRHADVLPFQPITLALVPSPFGWEAPAYLRFGEANMRPPEEVHVALFRLWHERYGAELVALTGDTVELVLSEPVKDTEAVWQLAREHHAYCPSEASLRESAAQIRRDSVWFFWWD